MKEIYDRICSVIERTVPNYAAIETTFYSKNIQSLIKLTMARDAAIMAVINNGITINEYSPLEIKRAVTGRGNSSKEQVRFMMRALLNITESPKYYDTTDALSIAVCHSNHIATSNQLINNNIKSASRCRNKNNSWSQYINNNPDRIVKL